MARDPGADERPWGEETVLILAPTVKDAKLSRAILAEAGVESRLCRDVGELCHGIDAGAGLAMLSEEALTSQSLELLRLAIRRQPAWSDFPVIVLTQEGADSELVLRTLETLGNVTLLERPVRLPALVSAVRSALRARRRQYEIRDHVLESQLTAQSLRDADRRKDEFLAILAHELRNPLAPLRNALELLRQKPLDAHTLAWARPVMERQVGQLVRLIDDLLDLSRFSRGRVALRREDVALAEIVKGALEIASPAIQEARHSLDVQLPPQPTVLFCDATRMVQVLSNLLSNAAKYTPAGGRIALHARRVVASLEISVRDSGVGIPPDMLERVFEMFTQVERSLDRAQGGLGIGLTLVRRLVELHGGSVEARSAGPGKGSEFIVRVPVRDGATPRPLADPERAVLAVPRRRRVLIADDNRDAADTLALMLRTAGHEVQTAYDGEEAVDLARAFQPALALIDIGMPRLNGYDAAKRIRSLPDGDGMVLVALTGWGQPDDKQRSRTAGFNHHLVKPVDPSTLYRLLA